MTVEFIFQKYYTSHVQIDDLKRGYSYCVNAVNNSPFFHYLKFRIHGVVYDLPKDSSSLGKADVCRGCKHQLNCLSGGPKAVFEEMV